MSNLLPAPPYDFSKDCFGALFPAARERMRFLGCNGHDFELERAKKFFEPWRPYVVVETEVSAWNHHIVFEGIFGSWNGVMFERWPEMG